MKMKSFTQSDWDAFAGCESSDPKISEFDFEVIDAGSEGELTYSGVVVQDGKYVQCHIMNVQDDTDQVTLHKEFEDEYIAEAFANGMRDVYTETEMLQFMHFEII